MFGGQEGREGHTLSVDIRMIVPTLSVDIRMIVPISDYQDCVWGRRAGKDIHSVLISE